MSEKENATPRRTGCGIRVLELYTRDGRHGQVWFVNTNIDEKLVLHYYYIPPGALPTDKAQNVSDTGFTEYPELTVAQVQNLGTRLTLTDIKQLP